MNNIDINNEMSQTKKIKGFQLYHGKLNYGIKFSLYKDMLKYEPRLWTKNHHLIRMLTNTFTVNFTLYCIYKMYYKFYKKNEGLVISLKNSSSMKFLLSSVILVDSLLIYLNYIKLDEYVYDRYYSQIPDEDFLKMHDSLVTVKKFKKQDFYNVEKK